MFPRTSVVDSIDCVQEDLYLVDICRVKNPLSKALHGVKTLQRYSVV